MHVTNNLVIYSGYTYAWQNKPRDAFRVLVSAHPTSKHLLIYFVLMVRPLMEYACVVWDPHYQSQASVLEKRVQRRAARWVLSG